MKDNERRRRRRRTPKDTPEKIRVNLRLERERVGLEIEDVANQARIPLRFVEFLETGDRSRVETGPYLLAYKKQYLRFLGLPTNATLYFKVKERRTSSKTKGKTKTITTTGFIPTTSSQQLITYSVVIAMLFVIGLRAISTFIDKTNWGKGDVTENAALSTAGTSGIPTTTSASNEPELVKNARVTIRARENVFVDVTTDGQIRSMELEAGDKEYLDFYGRLDLWTKSINQLDIYYNGKRVEPQGSLTRERTLVFATNKQNL